MVEPACNPSTQEGDKEEETWRTQSHPRLHVEFKASLDYIKPVSK